MASRKPVSLPGTPMFGWKSLYVDDEGSTWLGSTATGLHRLIDATITVHSETGAFSLKGAYSLLQDLLFMRSRAPWGAARSAAHRTVREPSVDFVGFVPPFGDP